MDDKKYQEIIKSAYFCAYPFVQVSTVPAGFMRPCCFFTDFLKNDDGTNSNVDKNDFQNVWNNKNFKIDCAIKICYPRKKHVCDCCRMFLIYNIKKPVIEF